jgi:hypothetical protein
MARPRVWDGNPETAPDAPHGSCELCGSDLQRADDGVCLECRADMPDDELAWSEREDEYMDTRS